MYVNGYMSETSSLDDLILNDRKSTFIIRVSGKKKRLNLVPGDFLVVDKNLPLMKGKLALLVVNNKFHIDLVNEEFLKNHDPENGNFIWGMVKTIVRELK
jgi:SOS-response transcriptional repressor LexA